MNLRDFRYKKAAWYFAALVALLLLVSTGKKVVMDTYFYKVSLNLLIFLIPYVILRNTNKLRYYSYVVGCTFFTIWFVFFELNALLSKGVTGHITEQLQVTHYTPLGKAGRGTTSGIAFEYKGETLYFETTQESQKLYYIYGDSVIHHLKVRLVVKETLPHVYYVDDVLMTYSQ